MSTPDPGTWIDRAACKGQPIGMFYQEQYISQDALALCGRCPVREPCLEWAVRHEQVGVWGGTSAKDRRAIRSASGVELVAPERQKPARNPQVKRTKARGAANGNAVLDEQTAALIKHAKGTNRGIAAQFGVSYGVVAGIRSGRTWRHIP